MNLTRVLLRIVKSYRRWFCPSYKADCEARGIPFEIVHTSGHASIVDLKQLAAAVAPERVIPIHTFERDRFPELFNNVTLVDDGQWIAV